MNVELTLPSEHKKITSTFVIEGTQTVENEEYKDIIKELSKNEKSRTTMTDEVSNLKNLENPSIHFAVNEQSEKFTQYGNETTLLSQLVETSMHFKVKEYNAVTTEINDKNYYIIIAQFKQQPKEMDWNIVETITERTDQSKRKIVIRTSLPENTAQCFDVACKNAMAKMDYTIGLYFQCLYLQFLSKEFVQQFEESQQQQHLVVFIDENENEHSLKSVEGNNKKSQSEYDIMVKEQKIEYDHMIYVLVKEVQELINNNLEDLENSIVKIRDEHLHAEDRTREWYNRDLSDDGDVWRNLGPGGVDR